MEFYRLVQKITTSEIHRTKDGIMGLLKFLKQHNFESFDEFISLFISYKKKLLTMPQHGYIDAVFVKLLSLALNKQQFFPCAKVTQVTPLEWNDENFPTFTFMAFLADIQAWYTGAGQDGQTQREPAAGNVIGQVGRTYLAKQVFLTDSVSVSQKGANKVVAIKQPNPLAASEARQGAAFLATVHQSVGGSGSENCMNCNKPGHRKADCPLELIDCPHCNDPVIQQCIGGYPRKVGAPRIVDHCAAFCNTLSRFKSAQSESAHGGGHNKQARFEGGGRGRGRGRSSNKEQSGGRGRGRGRHPGYHTTYSTNINSAAGAYFEHPTSSLPSVTLEFPDVCYTKVTNWLRPISVDDFGHWMDALHGCTPQTRTWLICDDLPPLSTLDPAIAHYPRAYMAQFYKYCHNDLSHPVHSAAGDDIIQANWDAPATSSGDGSKKIIVKLFHDADVRNGHQGRFRTMFPYALMTRLSVLPLAPERDSVFVDSCAAINVFPSAH